MDITTMLADVQGMVAKVEAVATPFESLLTELGPVVTLIPGIGPELAMGLTALKFIQQHGPKILGDVETTITDATAAYEVFKGNATQPPAPVETATLVPVAGS